MKRMIDEKQLQFVKDVKVNGVSVVSNGTAYISDIVSKERHSINSVSASNFTDTVSTTALGNMYLHRCYFVESGVEYTITIQATASDSFTSLQTILQWLGTGTNTVAGITVDSGSATKEGIIFKVQQSDQYEFDLYVIA